MIHARPVRRNTNRSKSADFYCCAMKYEFQKIIFNRSLGVSLCVWLKVDCDSTFTGS